MINTSIDQVQQLTILLAFQSSYIVEADFPSTNAIQIKQENRVKSLATKTQFPNKFHGPCYYSNVSLPAIMSTESRNRYINPFNLFNLFIISSDQHAMPDQ